MKERKEREWE